MQSSRLRTRRRLRQSDFKLSSGRRLRIESLEDRRLLSAYDVLVFSRTAGFRHASIEPGIAAIEQLGAANEFTVTATEDAAAFNAANLAEYEAVVFLNTTGNVLTIPQQAAMEQYIQGGGGFVGIHAAADTEYNWAWYGDLVGAYFDSHPAIQQATIVVADQAHPSTAHLADRWVRTDEWYNYRTNPRGGVHVLATLGEGSYSGGSMGFDHPIAWCQDFDGGRSWYTGLGHTSATFAEPQFLDHLLGGIEYAAGAVAADCGATVEANFDVVVLDDDTFNPMSLTVAPDGRVIYVERGGAIKILRPDLGDTVVAGNLNVYMGQEDGLLGVALDPNFAQTGWMYLFYSPQGAPARQHVSRFTLEGDQLDLNSEQILLEIPTQRAQCCHSAGSLAFGPDGDLFISTGDDTNPFESNGYAPIDERPGRSAWDAQKSSSNAADLRGKILRITPQEDGTYAIPAGNLFPPDGSAGRPEIFVMGNRNPFRISVDPATGWLYWGEVGPDANNSNNRGPRGYDEINQARAAGNFGWPYFVADNRAYREFDFANNQAGPAYDPAAPENNSPNNTGPKDLPPAQEAFIWYPYGSSAEFPEITAGNGRTAMAGPVVHTEAGLDAENRLPAYYDNTLFIYEWSRGWIKEVKLDDDGNLLKINPFLPSEQFRRPMDMELGPDGALYLLEWGTSFGGNNNDSRLVRIDYLNNAPPPLLTGDFNGNGVVEQADLDLVLLHWGQDGQSVPPGWIGPPATGLVDQDELDAVLLNWGTMLAASAPPSVAALLVESAEPPKPAPSDELGVRNADETLSEAKDTWFTRVGASREFSSHLYVRAFTPEGRGPKRSIPSH